MTRFLRGERRSRSATEGIQRIPGAGGKLRPGAFGRPPGSRLFGRLPVAQIGGIRGIPDRAIMRPGNPGIRDGGSRPVRSLQTLRDMIFELGLLPDRCDNGR